MQCIKPLNAYRTPVGVFFAEQKCKGHDYTQIKIACGRCHGCRLSRSYQWSIRITHEAQLHKENSFITLTIDDEKIKDNEYLAITLNYEEIKKFYKKLRKKYKIRHFTAGEYGEKNGRAHYHACIFGKDWKNEKDTYRIDKNMWGNKTLDKIWGYGKVGIAELNQTTAAYVARYNMKKITGRNAKQHYEVIIAETGEIIEREPEMLHMSCRPAIGLDWLRMYWQDVKDGMVVMNGKRIIAPKYYRKYLANTKYAIDIQDNLETYNYERTLNDKRTEEKRLADEEKILEAALQFKKRNLIF